ncbi:histone-lysine N-methyltransferase SUVR5-like [Vicia villosa]|uniref:histone-lysine N-methyltransferase SUVR5-like n=1 Tax=Vicia villosa TaxID=3911 RepID=UPI00273B47EF|nr:histone-lysine N-methyltransferase SUVR5-like [Vicia villosa]
MENMVVEMINIVEQIHSHALIEDACDVMIWKQFTMEASACQSYSDLGGLVQRLQKSKVQHYITEDWKLSCSKSWFDPCEKAKNAEIIELLNENVAPEPKVGYVRKTWKHDVMKWFSRNPLFSSSIGSHPHASSYGLCQTNFQLGFRRGLNFKFTIHVHVRRIKCTVEEPIETEFPSQLMNELSDMAVKAVDSDILPVTEMVSKPMDDEEAIELFVEPDTDNTKSRQCEKFIEAKGRQCRGRAIGSDKYCCAHFSRKPAKEDKAPTPMCGGTTMAGTKCKHHSHPGFSFCRKHLSNVETKTRSNLKRRRSKRKAKVYCSGSTSKRRVREDIGIAPPRSPLDIDPVSVIDDDSIIARNILGETLVLSGNDYNEALQWIDSPLNDNDTDNDNSIKCKVCFEEFSDDQSLCNNWMENHEREAHWLFMSYACAICLDSFTNKKLLESHVPNRHHVQFIEHCLLLKCNACSGNFGNMDEFGLHVKSIHSSEFKVSKAPKQLTLTHGDDSLEMIEHINEASLEEPQPNNLNILSIACSNSCEVNLEASLMEKYGYLPERLNLKASEDCSEREILENSHQDEIHSVASPHSLKSSSLQKAIVLCDYISFRNESTPVICVLDQEILVSLFEK